MCDRKLGIYRRLAAFMRAGAVILIVACAVMPDAEGQDRYAAPRKAMVDTIVALTRETAAETGRASLDSRVLTAMNKVPRHRFVPADQEPNAYANRPLPIGNGQTISQPFIVAVMTDMLGLKATDRVLEIGTGCGYQAAVLSRVATEVYSIERLRGLHEKARANLSRELEVLRPA